MSTSRRVTADEEKILDAARCCKKEDIETLLKSREVHLNVAAENGSTAVHFSSKAADLSSLGLLLEHGARTDVFDNSGMAPMHYASGKDYVDTLALLIAYKGDVNLRNKKTGKTALHYACEFNNSYAMNFLLCCGADFRLSDNTDKCPNIESKQVKDNLDIQQAFKDKKIITFGKMVQRMEIHVFSQVKFTVENTNPDSKEFSFFCRTMPIEFMDTDTIFPSQLFKSLERPDLEAVSDVYGYVVNQRVTDVTVTVPIYSTPDKSDDIFVEDSKGCEYKCQEIKQSKEGRFLVACMTFEVDRENLMSFIVLKKSKTDRHIVNGREQTLVSSVEDKFVVCLPANCLPKNSSVKLKVHPTDGFNNTLNTSSFCEILTEHILLEQLYALKLPCSTQRSTHEGVTSSVYNSQDGGMTWVEVLSEVVDTGDAVKVLDKSIYNGTYIVTESTQKQTKHISSWIKHFLKWLYSMVIKRKKHCSFMAMTKPVREDKFKILVLLTDEKTSESFLDKWKNVNYITQRSQVKSGYLCRPGQVFTVEVDKGSNSVSGSSSLELRYQSGRESHQEFIINGKENDLAVVYISKRETGKSHMGNMARVPLISKVRCRMGNHHLLRKSERNFHSVRGILTQINVDLVKEISDANTVVAHKFHEYPDDRCISWLADELGYEWAMVGVGLFIKYSHLESMEMGNDSRRTNLKMLYAWSEMVDRASASDMSYIIWVDNLVSCLILVGRYDLATAIRKHVKQLIKDAPSERICKCVESYPNLAECLLGDLDDVKGDSMDKDRIKDSFAVVSPFADQFLVIIVIVIGFNIFVLYQLSVSQDRIEHINHHIKDSEAAMFKCLIVAKRGYSDETTFYDHLLKALKHDGNNQAISDIIQQCMRWLRYEERPHVKKTGQLENVLEKYCALNELPT